MSMNDKFLKPYDPIETEARIYKMWEESGFFNPDNLPVRHKEPFTITKGMKVAQAVLCPVVNGKWVDLVKKETITNKDRAENGFGSTGI